MAVVGKQRKSGITYYVATSFAKRVYWERSGTDKREAERLDARRRREVDAGTFQPTEVVRVSMVAEYVKQWGEARSNISAEDDRRNLARFMAIPEFSALPLDDVRPRHVIGALTKLKGTVALKTLQNAYGTLRTMFRDAQIAELVGANPCVLPRGFFSGEDSKEREPYTRAEAAVLVSHHSIPWPIRVLNALCILAGLREGEACGRRWRDLDTETEPLWALEVGSQYGGRVLKTKRARVAPVHPELAVILGEWGADGYRKLMGSPPTPDDYIVPYATPRTRDGHHTRSTYYKAFVNGCRSAGIPNKSLHSMRHTMITLARRGGARKDILEQVSHNAKGDIVDRYTHRDWAELCEPVAAIGSLFDARQSPRRTSVIPEETPPAPTPGIVRMLVDSRNYAALSPLQFPAPPLKTPTTVGVFVFCACAGQAAP